MSVDSSLTAYQTILETGPSSFALSKVIKVHQPTFLRLIIQHILDFTKVTCQTLFLAAGLLVLRSHCPQAKKQSRNMTTCKPEPFFLFFFSFGQGRSSVQTWAWCQSHHPTLCSPKCQTSLLKVHTLILNFGQKKFFFLKHLLLFRRKTNDNPEYYREEAEMVVPSYGYFIRGAQTTFSGVLRLVQNICFPHWMTCGRTRQRFRSWV